MSKTYNFSVLWGDEFDRSDESHLVYENDAAAKLARDACAKLAAKRGFKVRRWSLTNQTRQYWGWQSPCGMSCNVYKLDIAA
jgi:hypothetical protein